MTGPDRSVRKAAAELVERSAVARGLPRTIDDASALEQIAALVPLEPLGGPKRQPDARRRPGRKSAA